MKLSNILLLYRVRLRARAAQECLTIVGIAAGVALLFASQVSSSSLQGSVSDLEHGIVGNATLQLAARDPHGISQGVVERVRRLAGVRFAAPLLEADAQASGPDASESVELVGADESLAQLGGTLRAARRTHPVWRDRRGRHSGAALACAGSRPLWPAGHVAARRAHRAAPLYAQLGERQIGQLARSPVMIAPLSYAQEMAGLQGRVSRVLIQPDPGAQTRVRAELAALTAGRSSIGHANVEPIDYEATLFANAVSASSQSSTLFSAISALVGFLFAFNATLLTVPARRRLIVDLRRDGYAPRTVIATLCLDALVLGVLASALGLALGDVLFTHVLRSEPGFSLAFTVGSEQSVSFTDVAIAAAGGMLAALAAVLSPCARSSRTTRSPRPANASSRAPGGRRAHGACRARLPRRSQRTADDRTRRGDPRNGARDRGAALHIAAHATRDARARGVASRIPRQPGGARRPDGAERRAHTSGGDRRDRGRGRLWQRRDQGRTAICSLVCERRLVKRLRPRRCGWRRPAPKTC